MEVGKTYVIGLLASFAVIVTGCAGPAQIKLAPKQMALPDGFVTFPSGRSDISNALGCVYIEERGPENCIGLFYEQLKAADTLSELRFWASRVLIDSSTFGANALGVSGDIANEFFVKSYVDSVRVLELKPDAESRLKKFIGQVNQQQRNDGEPARALNSTEAVLLARRFRITVSTRSARSFALDEDSLRNAVTGAIEKSLGTSLSLSLRKFDSTNYEYVSNGWAIVGYRPLIHQRRSARLELPVSLGYVENEGVEPCPGVGVTLTTKGLLRSSEVQLGIGGALDRYENGEMYPVFVEVGIPAGVFGNYLSFLTSPVISLRASLELGRPEGIPDATNDGNQWSAGIGLSSVFRIWGHGIPLSLMYVRQFLWAFRTDGSKADEIEFSQLRATVSFPILSGEL